MPARSAPVRALFLSSCVLGGGAGWSLYYLIKHLDRARFRVGLWSGGGGMLDDEAAKVPDLDRRIIREMKRQISPRSDSAALATLVRMLREDRKDIIAPCSEPAPPRPLALACARATGTSVLWQWPVISYRHCRASKNRAPAD